MLPIKQRKREKDRKKGRKERKKEKEMERKIANQSPSHVILECTVVSLPLLQAAFATLFVGHLVIEKTLVPNNETTKKKNRRSKAPSV
jgi:hypothetical protein